MASVHENAISQTLILKFSLLRKFRAGARWAPKSAPSNFIFQKIFTELYCYFLENVTFRIFQQILSKPDHFGVSWGLSYMQPVCVPCIEMTESIRFLKVLRRHTFLSSNPQMPNKAGPLLAQRCHSEAHFSDHGNCQMCSNDKAGVFDTIFCAFTID